MINLDNVDRPAGLLPTQRIFGSSGLLMSSVNNLAGWESGFDGSLNFSSAHTVGS